MMESQILNSINNGRNSNSDSETEFQNPINGISFNSSTDLEHLSFEDFDSSSSFYSSSSSTPYVSAPSSPNYGLPNIPCFFYSAPTSPMHFSSIPKNPISSSSSSSMENQNHSISFEFDFCSRFGSKNGSMSSADELFFNGKIKPMNFLTDNEEIVEFVSRGRRDCNNNNKIQRRRTRSMSPLRNEESFVEEEPEEEEEEKEIGVEKIDEEEEIPCSISASSSRSSSSSRRNSKRWVFLKDFLYRSKSEGSNRRINNPTTNFWSNLPSFSSVKEKKKSVAFESKKVKAKAKPENGNGNGNGKGKRRIPSPSPSAHELHYKANRAHSEEMKKKTYLPYRQGLLGCLGFSSKGYGAVNGFAKALNSVSSR